MKKISLIIILLFLFSSLSIAQTRWQKKRIIHLENKLEKTKDGIEKLEIYDELAEIHLGFNPSKSIEYLDKTKKIIRKNNPSLTLEANIYNSYGAAYFYLKDYKNSAKYYENELKILKKSDNTKKIAESEYNIATIYLVSGNKKKARNYYESSLNYAKQINNEDIMMLNYKALYEIYNDSGILHNDSKALENLKLFISLHNAQVNFDSRKKISILRRKYKVERDKRIDTEEELQETDSTLQIVDSTLKVVGLQNELLEQEAILKEIEINLMGAEKELTIEKLKSQENEIKLQDAEKTQMQILILAISIIGIIIFIALFWLLGLYKKNRNKTKRLKVQKNEIETQAEELRAHNSTLKQQKEEILTQRNEIEQQRDIVIKQNVHITDSIRYAQKIQQAVLPSKEMLKQALPDHFVLFKPLDVVSGDFYWMKQINNFTIIAATDCTGHGVPGAFMSMLGMGFLNEIVTANSFNNAGEILNQLRIKIKTALRQKGKIHEQKDGMDMALCVIDRENLKLKFAGAYNSLYLVREKNKIIDIENYENYKTIEQNEKTLIDIKADRQPVSVYVREKPFTNKEINLHKNDLLYIFTDGYADQPGGEKNKKYLTKNFKKLLLSVNQKSMSEQHSILDKSLENWKSGYEQIDDILVIGIKI